MLAFYKKLLYEGSTSENAGFGFVPRLLMVSRAKLSGQ